MHHSLLCTNQARANETIINDIPPEYDLTSNDQEFAITFPKEDVTLALSNRGPIPHLNVRYPTDHDIDNCPHLILTDSVQEWDPYKGEISKLNMEFNFDHKFNSNFCESFDYTLINLVVKIICALLISLAIVTGAVHDSAVYLTRFNGIPKGKIKVSDF